MTLHTHVAHTGMHTYRHTHTASLEIISGLSAPYMHSIQEDLSPSRSLSPAPCCCLHSNLVRTCLNWKKILLDHGNVNICLRQKKNEYFFFLNSDGETAKHNTNFRCCEKRNSGTQTNLALSPLSRRTVSPGLFTADDGAPSAGCLVLLVFRPALVCHQVAFPVAAKRAFAENEVRDLNWHPLLPLAVLRRVIIHESLRSIPGLGR